MFRATYLHHLKSNIFFEKEKCLNCFYVHGLTWIHLDKSFWLNFKRSDSNCVWPQDDSFTGRFLWSILLLYPNSSLNHCVLLTQGIWIKQMHFYTSKRFPQQKWTFDTVSFPICWAVCTEGSRMGYCQIKTSCVTVLKKNNCLDKNYIR